MKSLHAVVTGILALAVIFLLYREFSGPASAEGQSTVQRDVAGLQVAYLNYDSLISKYEYHQELKSQLEEKAKELEADLAKKSQVFQENVAVLQERAGSLSDEQLQQAQMELQQTQQQLMMYQEEKSRELAEQEKELTDLLREDLDEVLGRIKREESLDMIFSYDRRSDLLAVDTNLNLTARVIKTLNDKYNENRKRQDSIE